MAEPIRKDEPLTTGDLASKRVDVDYIGNPIRAAELQNENPRRARLAESDSAIKGLRNEALNNAPGTRRERDMNRSTAEATSPNQWTLDTTAPLFNETEISDFRSRWGSVQTEFVDDPRRAVQGADQLVATVMQRLAEGFANERTSLEKQWDRGDNVSTEDLRVALQRYRTFFGRLLNAA